MNPVSELSALRYENNLLKQQALQTQYTLLQREAQTLIAEERALLVSMKTEAQVPENAVWNPQTKQFFSSDTQQTPSPNPSPSPTPVLKFKKPRQKPTPDVHSV